MAKRLTALVAAGIVCLAPGVGLRAQQAAQQTLIDRVSSAPADIAARLELARTYVSQGRLDEAERLLNEALALVRAQRQAEAGAPPPAGIPVRVSGTVKEPALLKHVAPRFPKIAQAARVQGAVIVEVLVGKDGRVAGTTILKSHPLFDEAALEAVREWRYAPTVIGGEPVEVLMVVTVRFDLR